MQLTNISISARAFDNEPFIRKLTVTLMNTNDTQTVEATGSSLIQWSFPVQNTYALTNKGTQYFSSFVAPVSEIGTMNFYFSATPYDYTTTVYSLCTLAVRARDITRDVTTIYTKEYDTFPNIDLTLLVNYENASQDPYRYFFDEPDPHKNLRSSSLIFYRLTSEQPYSANVLLSSTTYNLITALTSTNHQAWFTINNTTKVNLSSQQYSFNRPVPCLSSVQGYLSAFSAPGSLSAWYSTHIVKKEISATFVPFFPTATFIAYPSTFFIDPYSLISLTESNFYTQSPGVCFYGEGHTENIILSAANLGAFNYIWKLNNNQLDYSIIPVTDHTGYTTIPSRQDFYPIIPISLFVSNSFILSSSPGYYVDDTTGEPAYYPFYTSTLDLSGKEAQTNNRLKQSIIVAPYAAEYFILFDPGVQPTIYLPLNGGKREYQASFDVFLNNPGAVSACFDRHNTIWKWSTFTDCTAVETAVFEPSSWATTQCSADYFPKKWVKEGIDDPPVAVPIFCTLSSIMWTLSAYTPVKAWFDLPIIQDSNTFTYSLQLSEYGGELDETTSGFTVSRYSDTFLTVTAKQTAFCSITAQFLNGNPLLVVNDWTVKPTILERRFNFTSVEPYELKVYTPNRYVLLETPVFIQNLFERATPAVTGLEVTLDDVAGETVFLTGNAVGNNFTVSYSSVGDKTISFTGYSQFYSDTNTVTYPNLVRVFEAYDIVNPDAYFNFDRIAAELPWKEQPSVGSNDWVVNDNINSCIKKFYENLAYLDRRSNVYLDTYNEYFGWLGSEPTVIQGVTSCPVFTWDDADCSIPDNIYTLTWTEVMSGGVIPEVSQTGSYADCGTWEQQTCPLSSVVPNCLGKYCVEWKWSSRKSSNSTALVTWKDTQCSVSRGKFGKVWRQPLQECETVENINCDEGVWNVNIPGLDLFYDPIPECYSQNRCTYTSIASYKNNLYLTQRTQVKLLSSDRTATFYDLRTTYNDATPFVDIKSIALDSQQRIYVLDGTLSQVSVYDYKQNAPGERWALFTTFGGIGGSTSKTKFFNPNELHVDQFDNVWIADTGNYVLKLFTYTGSWLFTLRDDEYFKLYPPLSLCVDSQSYVHVLLSNNTIRVYTYQGQFLYEYTPGRQNKPFLGARKINTNYNREIVYIASKSQVIRHYRTGNYSGTIIDEKQCVDNITDVFQDEYRNLLITNDNKVLKFVDTMTIVPLKSPLPEQYWSLNDLLIHEEEYVQNWVYTKVLHRLWDNIEIFRNTLNYSSTGECKQYKPPLHPKNKITVGQNEIVTSTVINRSLKYLWENFMSIMEYYNPNC